MPRIRFYRRCASSAGSRSIRDDGHTTIDYCTCRAFDYNGSCEHITALRKTLCLWDEADDNTSDAIGLRCPRCGGPTAIYRAS
jgi:hypothetical protein